MVVVLFVFSNVLFLIYTSPGALIFKTPIRNIKVIITGKPIRCGRLRVSVAVFSCISTIATVANVTLLSVHVTCGAPPLSRERALSWIRKSRVNKARKYLAEKGRFAYSSRCLTRTRGRRERSIRAIFLIRVFSFSDCRFDLISKSGFETSRITARARVKLLWESNRTRKHRSGWTQTVVNNLISNRKKTWVLSHFYFIIAICSFFQIFTS